MPLPPPTLDELVSTLSKSSLPTIIVEGNDDLLVYRWVEQKIGSFEANILPCGGRKNVLALYDRKDEFSHLNTAFLADRDMWLFTTIPRGYNEIIFTQGYSIENDIFVGSKDIIELLFELGEKEKLNLLLENIIPWFAHEIQLYKNSQPYSIDHHIDEIIPKKNNPNYLLASNFLERRGFIDPDSNLIDDLSQEFELKIRGKLLMNILLRILSNKDYKTKQLLEIMIKFKNPNVFLERIINEIKKKLEI